jgi:2-amino-4-hydroxy-6-hydroxymethyldihydropteridine diphosphokinase
MRAFIGLGSNLGEPKQQILSTINEIKQIAETNWISSSSLYASPPMGPQDQPDYINAVVEIDTQLEPHQLLDALQQLEQSHGRIRKRHWGERTLDLDILSYGDLILHDERLTLPHPGVAERAFVIYPLAEIAPDLNIPKLGKASMLKAACDAGGIMRLE